jgi:hypothetical protein
MQLPKAGFVHYPGVHLSMRCFAAAGKFKGVSSVQIQCSSADGRKSLISIARR